VERLKKQKKDDAKEGE